MESIFIPKLAYDTGNQSNTRRFCTCFRSVKLAPPTHEKKSKPIWEFWAIYKLSNSARKNFWALPIFEKSDIEVGGGGGGASFP